MNLKVQRTVSPLTPAVSPLKGEGKDSRLGGQTTRFAVQRSNRGSAVMVVLVLLGVMAILVIANTTTLHQLRQELDQIDKQQQKKYGQDSRH